MLPTLNPVRALAWAVLPHTSMSQDRSQEAGRLSLNLETPKAEKQTEARVVTIQAEGLCAEINVSISLGSNPTCACYLCCLGKTCHHAEAQFTQV